MKIPGRPEWLTSKIGRRFALYVAFFGVIMAMALSLFISWQQYRTRVALLEDELDTIATANKSFIEKSLWILDIRALDLVIQGFLLNDDIVFAQITDDNGKTIVSRGMPDIDNEMKKTVSLYHQDAGKSIFLGRLTVTSSKQAAFRRAQSLIFITFFQSALLMFIISVSIMFIFQRLVVRHLATIQRYTRKITFEEPQDPLSLDRPSNRHTESDELASTVNAINFMYSNAVNAYRKLKEQAEEKIMLERQLRQAQKLESIGRLAGGIAHDFNNVLSVIIGYSDMLLTLVSPDDPMREPIQLIHDSGNRAEILTRQLLAFSRKQVLEKKVISINTLVQDFLKILGKIAGEDIIFTTCLAEEGCIVEADPGQIEQIIMNLIVNARDSMPGGGEIIIETAEVQLDGHYVDTKHREVKAGKYVLLAVSDTGEGMDEEVLPKIFDPFFTTKEQGKGTGLGLATVYGIVKQHDGYIYAYSEKDKGTIFKIYFPVSDKTSEGTESEFAAASVLHGNETILIVDDNTSIRQLIVDMLKPLGYKCLQAGSGQDAIELLSEYGSEVHLLLTDVVMPGISGRELSTVVRKERPEMKVIFMSGYTENIIVNHGVLEQGINYIAKPITPSVLTQKIRRVLYDHEY